MNEGGFFFSAIRKKKEVDGPPTESGAYDVPERPSFSARFEPKGGLFCDELPLITL